MLEAAQRATKLTPNKARALLGRFLFSGEAAEKPVDGLSGGERRRLSLAILVHSGANVLILDEPTNHLDLESREALEDALQAFQGSLLLISHDRALLDAVGTRTVAVEDGDAALLRRRLGRVPARARGARARPSARPKRGEAAPKPRTARRRAAAAAAPSKNQRRQAERLEAEIEQAEAALRALEEELADPRPGTTRARRRSRPRRHEAGEARASRSSTRSWEASRAEHRDGLAPSAVAPVASTQRRCDRIGCRGWIGARSSRAESAATGGGALSAVALERLAAARRSPTSGHHGPSSYGEPQPMPDQRGIEVLALPAGFSYVTFGHIGSTDVRRQPHAAGARRHGRVPRARAARCG